MANTNSREYGLSSTQGTGFTFDHTYPPPWSTLPNNRSELNL
jgi:hypothetical protein